MKKHIFILIFILTLLWNNVKAHTIPTSSIPRLSYAAILALPAPHKGDLAYDLTYDVMRLYNNAGWVKMATLPPPPCDSFTALSGGGEYDNEITYDAATDNAGNVFVIGAFFGTVTFGEFTLTSEGDYEVFIAKYNVSGELEWAKRAGGPHNDFGTSLTVDNVGNIYITGFFYTMMNFNNPSDWGSNVIYSAGETDAFVAKYNSSGDVQWARRIGGTENDNAQAITVDNDGNAYVSGHFWGTANFNTPSESGSNELSSVGGQDIFIVKYNTSGDLAWVKRAGGTGSDYGFGITVDSGGNVYATGGFNDTIDFNTPSASGSNELVSDGNYDVYIVKLNNAGTIQWLKRAGGTNTDIGTGITIDNAGNAYVTGLFKDTVNFNTPSATGSNELVSAGDYDAFIAKYSTAGNVIWLKRAGGTGDDRGVDIAHDNVGNIYVNGTFNETMNFNNPSASGSNELVSAGGQDIFIAKYNPSGAVIWKNSAGGTDNEQATAMAISSTGIIHATGYFAGTSQFGSSSLVSLGGYDFFLTYLSIPPPDPTDVSVSSTAICSGASISLSATCEVGVVTWYDQQTGGTAIGTGAGFSQSPIINTTYYVACIDGACESGRVATNEVVVTTPPTAPTGTANSTICNNTTTSLSATCATGTVNWYDAGGTTLLFTASPFVTPNLTSNTIYKVRCENGTCLSAFIDVIVSVVTAPTSTSNPTICFNTTASLSATCATGTVKWYSSNSSTLLFTGSPFVTPNLLANTIYNVRCESGACLSSFVRIAVRVNFPKISASKTPLSFSSIVNFNSIDVGLYSNPAFNDIDGDGLLDLLIGSIDGNLVHYEQASANSLSFNFIANNFNSINVGTYASPTFTDLDGDGLLDLIIGENDGNLNYYEQASANSLTFNLITTTFNNIQTASTHTVPTFTDLDGDGLLDLIIGQYNGTIIHYEQVSVNSLTFNLVTTTFNNIDVGFLSTPTFTDLEGDGLLDLIIGEDDGNLNHYKQASTNSLTFNLEIANFNSIVVQFASTPVFTDLDGDGLLDFIIGEDEGILHHAEQLAGIFTNYSTTVGTPSATQTLQVWGGSCLNDNIVVTAPTDFEVSLSAGSGFGSSVSLTQSGGKVVNTTVYVRFNPSSGGAFAGNLQITSTNANTVSFALNGCSQATAPIGTANPTICNNTTASLSASCATGTVSWYNSSSSSLLSTTSPFVTPILTSTTTYNVRCEGCSISTFVPISVTVNSAVAAPSGTSSPIICNNTTTSLSATCVAGTVKWYDTNGTALQGTGSPFVTPNLSSNTTYKVRCESGGSPNCTSAFVDVIVTVNPAVAAPTGTANPTICSNTTTSLSASCAAGTVKWYDANGTVLQGTGSPFVTPSLSSNTTYKVRCESGGSPNCTSAFEDVVVTVSPAVAAPIGTSNPTICFNATASLSATCSSSSVKWYDTNGTALQSTGSPFLTPNLSSNGTYKVRCESGGSPNCTSAFVDVNVTVNPAVAAPTGMTNPMICFNATASLSATCAAGTVKWYDTNGTAFQSTGSPFVTPSLSSNTTYKVRCESGSCNSSFTTVLVTVNPNLTNPTAVAVSSTGICVGSSITLSATCQNGTITWYNQQTGGAALGTGNGFSQSPTINTTYYVSCESGICTSSRVATNTVLVVNPSSNLTIITDISSGNTIQIANQNITATNKVISPAKVVYRAGNSVLLNAGFEARIGSVFKAEIGGCSN